jgi:glucose/arabinose dehydrogenase
VRLSLLFALAASLPAGLFVACSTHPSGGNGGGADSGPTIEEQDGSFGGPFCELPGSLVFGQDTVTVIEGGKTAPDLSWITLPPGFCAHYFAHVGAARQIRFAPGGELFVASPTTPTAGGSPFGVGGIVVLADDNFDGYADGDVFPHSDNTPQALTMFISSLASAEGMLFTPGAFYYQNSTQILSLPYQTGQRAPVGMASMVANITIYVSEDHWPKTLGQADDGTIYVGNGGDQFDQCDPTVFPRPFHGGVLELDGTAGGTPVAQGFRNPIAVRCQKGHDHCFAAELTLDGSGNEGGREKLVPIRQGDDWGYPCCATTNVPFQGVGNPNCSSVADESVAFEVGHTPFGFDFEPGLWPAPYTSSVVLSLHGDVGSWYGARVVSIPTGGDGMPLPTSELDGGSPPLDLVQGWDDAKRDHGRPDDVAFSKDGRAFIANDVTGDIFWVAPVGLGQAKDAGAAPEAGPEAGPDGGSDTGRPDAADAGHKDAAKSD